MNYLTDLYNMYSRKTIEYSSSNILDQLYHGVIISKTGQMSIEIKKNKHQH